MIDADELPEGWVMVRLGEIVRSSKAKAEPGERDDAPYLSLEHIESGTSRILGQGVGSEVKSVKSVFSAGDILYGKLRPYLNKVCRPDFDGICSTDILVLQPSPAAEPTYLHKLLTTQPVVDYAVSNSNGINLPRTSFAALAVFEIPLPPLAEQKRIVARLEELQARSRAAREALADVPKLLEQYRQSVLAAAFRGDLTATWREQHPETEPASVLLERIRTERRKQWEAKYPKREYVDPEPVDDSNLPELPEGWAWTSVDELAEVVRGASPRPAGSPDFFNGKHTPWMTVAELTKDKDVYLTATSTMLTKAGVERSRYIESGTLLLTNSGATLGVPKITRIGGCINDGSVALLGIDDSFQHYLYYFLTSQTKNLRSINQGAAQPNLNTEIVKAIVVPLAPTHERPSLIRTLTDALARITKTRKACESLVTDLDHLDQSLLAKAFRGELVPQDPTDQPASVLLARLRSGVSVRTRQPISPAKLSRFVLMLLHHWNGGASREFVDRGVLLMMDDDLRERLHANGATPRPTKRGRQPAARVIALPNLLGKMIDAGFIRVGQRGDAQTIHAADIAKAKLAYETAESTDLERLQQTVKVMEVIEDKILTSELAEAFHGQTIEELVSY